MKEKVKSLFFFILKLGIAGAAVWFLLLRNPEEIFNCIKEIKPGYVAAAAAVYFTHMLVGSWRWWRLARMLNVELGIWEAVSLNLQGYFFSLVIPGGAIGGDVVKMGVISKRSRSGEKLEGVFTILMDRITGMIALFSMALILIPLTLPVLLNVRIPGLPESREIQILLIPGVALLCLSGIAASGVIFFHNQLAKVPLFRNLIQLGDKLTHGMVQRMTAAADVYSAKWKELLLLIIAGVFGVHTLTILPVCLLLTGLGAEYHILTVFIAAVIGNIAGLIPLFPAGVGGRDVITILILTAGGVAAADAKTAQLIYTAILLIVCIADGLCFVFDRGRKTQLQPEQNGNF